MLREHKSERRQEALKQRNIAELEQTVDLLTRMGDTEGAESYNAPLGSRRAAAAAPKVKPIQLRLGQALNQVRSLERRLQKAATDYQKLQDQLKQQRDWVAQVSSELNQAYTHAHT